MEPLITGLGAAAVVAIVSRAAAAELYLTTNGKDAWSGALPDPNNTKTDGPFATLAGARDAVRHSRRTP